MSTADKRLWSYYKSRCKSRTSKAAKLLQLPTYNTWNMQVHYTMKHKMKTLKTARVWYIKNSRDQFKIAEIEKNNWLNRASEQFPAKSRKLQAVIVRVMSLNHIFRWQGSNFKDFMELHKVLPFPSTGHLVLHLEIYASWHKIGIITTDVFTSCKYECTSIPSIQTSLIITATNFIS